MGQEQTKGRRQELEEFVREALLSIFRAIKDAGSQIASDPNSRGAVVPLWGGEEHLSNHEQKVDFDISVTVEASAEDTLKPTIRVPTLAQIEGAMSDKSTRSNVSRVSFSVPVAFPGTQVLGTTPRRGVSN